MIKVLHVDDSRDDLEIVSYQIERLAVDIHIRQVESAAAALKRIKKETYDCILSDYQMPDMNGLQFLKSLRAENNDIPFIFFTGQGNEELASEALRSGADDYYTKETGFAHYSRLVNSIHRVSESHKQRAEHREAQAALREVVAGTSAKTGADYFRSLVQHVAIALKMRYALIGELIVGTPEMIQTLSVWAGDDLAENFMYELKGTPCENILGKSLSIYPRGVQDLFPEDHLLAEMDVDSYIGAPLFDSQDKPLGILVVMHDEPIAESPLIESLMTIFAQRAGAELERMRAEESLAESEEKYRNLVVLANDSIIIIQDELLRFINPRLAEMTGYDMEEALNTPFTDFIHPDEVPRAIENYRKRMAGEDVPQIYETALQHKDGHRVEVEINAGIIKYQGKPADLVFIRDITERKKVEEALQESEETFRRIVENTPNIIFKINREGIFELSEGQGLAALNLKPGQVVGLSAYEVYKDYPQIVKGIRAALKGEVYFDEISVNVDDNEACFTIFYSPYADSTGSITACIGQAVNITEHKRAEEALRDREKRLRRAQSVAHMGFLDWDLRTSEIYLSDETQRLFGIVPDAGLTTPELVAQVVHPDDLEFVQKNLEMATQGTRDLDIDHRIVRPDGEVIWVHAQGELIRDAQGNPERLLGTTVDISERKLAEMALKESEERFRILSDSSFEGIAIHDKGVIVEANTQMAEMFGYELEEFIGMNALDIAAPESRKMVAEKIRNGHQKPYHAVGLKKDGTTFAAELIGRPIPYKERTLRVTAIRDITERKRAEEELRTSETRYRTLFEHSSDAILIIKDNKFVDCNEATVRMLRAKNKNQVLNTHPSELSPEFQPDGQSSYSKAEEMMRIAMENDTNRFEWDHQRLDGSVFPVEVLLTPIPEGDSFVIHTVWREITERRKAEKAVLESEKKFRTYVDNSPDGIFVVDESGKYVDVNPAACKILGYSKEELLSMSILSIAPPEHMKEPLKGFESLKDTGSLETDLDLIKKDGSFVHVNLKAVSLPGNRYMAFVRDITERKRRESDLAEKES